MSIFGLVATPHMSEPSSKSRKTMYVELLGRYVDSFFVRDWGDDSASRYKATYHPVSCTGWDSSVMAVVAVGGIVLLRKVRKKERRVNSCESRD